MTVEPLRWPDAMKHPTVLQRLFRCFPVLGLDKRVYRAFRRHVATRHEQDCLALWPCDAQTLRVRDVVFKVLDWDLRWKRKKLIPADPCDILFFDPRILLEGEDAGFALLGIYKLLDLGHEAEVPRGPDILNMTLGEFVDALAASVAVERARAITTHRRDA